MKFITKATDQLETFGSTGALSRQVCPGKTTGRVQSVASRSLGLTLTWRKTGGEMGGKAKTEARVNDSEIYAVCNDGTRVQGTFIIGSGTASGTGRATDTNGNIYKLLF